MGTVKLDLGHITVLVTMVQLPEAHVTPGFTPILISPNMIALLFVDLSAVLNIDYG